jgi:hypothetical protein
LFPYNELYKYVGLVNVIIISTTITTTTATASAAARFITSDFYSKVPVVLSSGVKRVGHEAYTALRLVLRLRIYGTVHLLFLYVFTAHTRTALPLIAL